MRIEVISISLRWIYEAIQKDIDSNGPTNLSLHHLYSFALITAEDEVIAVDCQLIQLDMNLFLRFLYAQI